MLVCAPASSANLGPGFDCLGLAVDLPFWLAVDDAGSEGEADSAAGPDPASLLVADATHLAAVAFVEAGGSPTTQLRWRSPIPPGRGLGFSGAARVAGAYAARLLAGDPGTVAQRRALWVAARLEGHPDNAAASALGGLTVVAGDRAVAVAVPEGLRLLAWWPATTTSTTASRRGLPETVPFADATFNVARAALWVAALAAGDFGALRTATEDRLHQVRRLEKRSDSAVVLGRFLEEPGVIAAWLSGSGPTVVALLADADSDADADADDDDAGGAMSGLESLPAGRLSPLTIDRLGVRRAASGAPGDASGARGTAR